MATNSSTAKQQQQQQQQQVEQTALLLSEDDDDDTLLDTDFNSKAKTTITSSGATFSQQPSSTITDNTKINRVQNQINDVLDGMRSNIGKVLERGQRLDDLDERSDQLTSSANLFHSRAKGTRKAMWLRTCRARMYLGGTIAVIVCLLMFFVYRIFKN